MVQMNVTVPPYQKGPALSSFAALRISAGAEALSVAKGKHLAADRERPFAALRVTGCDCSNGQGLVFTIEPCLTKIKRHTDGCSCAIHRTGGWGTTHNRVGLRYSELYLGHNKACV